MSATPRTHNSDGTRARGSSNGNERGSAEARRARKAYLLETYASDVSLIGVTYDDGVSIVVRPEPTANLAWWQAQVGVLPNMTLSEVEVVEVANVPTARCYRCGDLLHIGTVTVDRIRPGAHGGTYARHNIRPACGVCNSSTGATVRRKR